MRLIKKEFPFPSTSVLPAAHASNILKLPDGSFLCAWFAGQNEGTQDVSIWFSKRENRIWSTPEKISRVEEMPHWNPVLFQQKDDTICLFYKIGPNCSDWNTMLTTSRDGENWSEPKELIEGDDSGGRGPVRNKPLYLASGKLLAPGSSQKGAWLPFIDIYRKEKGWEKIPIPTDHRIKIIQPTLWEWSLDHVSALMRTDQGKIFRSDSSDGGESWCMAYPTSMPNNNSGIDCVRLQDGTLVLVCNPIDQNCGVRSPLSVFTSRDNGITFQKEMDLETDKSDFSYPSVIADGNRVYVTYTHRRNAIAFCELEL